MKNLKKLKKENISLYASLMEIEEVAKLVLNDRIHWDFTDHSIQHSYRIIEHLNKFFAMNKSVKLNCSEIFILYASIYLHDIGMQINNINTLHFLLPEITNFINDENINSVVRDNHHKLSKRWIEKQIQFPDSILRKVYFGPEILGYYVAIICQYHNENLPHDETLNDKIYQSQIIRLDLLALLLKIGDLLDCDNRRIDYEKNSQLNLSCVSSVHWKKHYYTSGIEYKNQYMIFHYDFPLLKDDDIKKIYKKFFYDIQINWLYEYKKIYKQIFQKYNILYEMDFKINMTCLKQPLNNEELSYISDEVLKKFNKLEVMKVAIGIVINDTKILMVKRKDTKENLIWQFPAGIIKPTQNACNVIESELYMETNIVVKVRNMIGQRAHPTTNIPCQYYLCDYISGTVKNGQPHENDKVEFISLEKYDRMIVSDLFYAVKRVINNYYKIFKEGIVMSEVVIAIVVKSQKILLVKRKMKEGDLLWQFPGGGIENNETPIKAIIREVMEETNIECKPLECLGKRIHPHTKKNIEYWSCEYLSGNAQINLDDDLDEVRWVSIDELYSLLTTDLYNPVEKYLKSKLTNN